jgi:hypothetical protein
MHPGLADDLITEALVCPCNTRDGPRCARCTCLVELACAMDVWLYEHRTGERWTDVPPRRQGGRAPGTPTAHQWSPRRGLYAARLESQRVLCAACHGGLPGVRLEVLDGEDPATVITIGNKGHPKEGGRAPARIHDSRLAAPRTRRQQGIGLRTRGSRIAKTFELAFP